jgi:hypothetical protein
MHLAQNSLVKSERGFMSNSEFGQEAAWLLVQKFLDKMHLDQNGFL